VTVGGSGGGIQLSEFERAGRLRVLAEKKTIYHLHSTANGITYYKTHSVILYT
jgi:hypothetical protein